MPNTNRPQSDAKPQSAPRAGSLTNAQRMIEGREQRIIAMLAQIFTLKIERDQLAGRVRALEESLGDACVFLLQAAEQGTLDAGEVGTLVAAYRAAITEFTAGARRQS